MTRARALPSKRVVIAALAANAGIAVTKLAAALLTGSGAMLSEAVHSAIDTGNQGLLLFGMARAARRPTPRHPLGFAREIYFWSFMVAVLIFGLGAGVSIVTGVHDFTSPRPLEDPLVNYVVLAIALGCEGTSWLVSVRAFRRTMPAEGGILSAIHRSKDPANFIVLLEDSAAILGLAIAAAGVFASHHYGNARFDAAASVAIGLVLGLVALALAYECKGLLIGESAAPQTVARIRSTLAGAQDIERVIDVIAIHLGPDDVVVAAEVDFRDRISAADVERTVAALERRIRGDHPEVTRVFIKPVDAAARAAAAA
jgi:cation diffusion facilitator family transporter